MGKEIATTGIVHNIIAHGTKIIGTIDTDKDIRIDGSLDGDLRCKGKVVVGQQGFVHGTVNCNNAEILGTVDGEMTIAEQLTLKTTAKVTGSIKTKILGIEPQALFSGTCDMGGRPAPQPSAQDKK